ncbi:MAG TPA: hypothetical protein DCQ98_07520 [Planctomycetaceae bacterium]|nr:hypothetical protein [Planctomycetaceae bacterium]
MPADFFLPPGVPMAADLVPLGERFGDGAGADWIRRNGVESPERRLSSAIATTWGGSADPIARASVSDTRMIGDLDLLRAAPEAARSPAFVVDGFDRPWGAEMPLGEPDRFGPLVPFGPEPLREDQPFGLPVASNSLQQSLLRTVILDENWRGTPDDWKLLPQVDGLTSMQINGRELSAGELTELTRCLRLTDLSLNRCKIDPQVIDAFLKQRPDLSVSATGKGRLGIYGATEQDGRGCLIGEVLQESPAAAAGLMSGDRIEQIDGIPTADFTRLALIVAMKEPGETLELMVLRDGKRRMLDVTLEPRP